MLVVTKFVETDTELGTFDEALKIVAGGDPRVVPEFEWRAGGDAVNVRGLVEHFAARNPDVGSPVRPDQVNIFILYILPSVLRANRYADFLKRLTGREPRTPADYVREAVILWLGEPAASAALAALRESLRDGLADGLAVLERRIQAWRDWRWAPDDPDRAIPVWIGQYREFANGFGAFDLRLWMLAHALHVRNDLARRLAALSAPGPDTAGDTAAHFQRLFTQAGGADRVAARITESRKARRVYYTAGPDGAELASLEHQHAGHEEICRRLGAGSKKAAGSHAAEAVAACDEVSGRAAALRSRIEARQEGEIADLVAKALAGDRAACEGVVMEVRAYPAAWPAGFAEALADRCPGEEPLDAVIEELSRVVEPHLYRPVLR